ncbi:protoheme IX farnesyltransferase [Bacteroidota bacterium]
MLAGVKKYLNLFMEVGKFRITSFVAVSTSVGFILASGKIDLGIILPTIGVFLIASGSSALNHFQERDTDALMDRTKNRPIPAQKIKPGGVLLLAVIFIFAGSFILYTFSNLTALLLGWLALFWYNVIYTPMKRRFAMAVVPGSLIGAIPPVIGWVAGGGELTNPQVYALALFFFIWQIPHFWLLLLIHGKDYENAGFPTLTQIFNDSQLGRITFVWIAALAISVLLIPFFGVSSNFVTGILLVVLGVWLVNNMRKILSDYLEKIIFRKAFMAVNLYVLIVVLLLSIDRLLLK